MNIHWVERDIKRALEKLRSMVAFQYTRWERWYTGRDTLRTDPGPLNFKAWTEMLADYEPDERTY